MLKDLSFDLFEVLNKITIDKYGRVSAFLALNKPKGITSHDLVDQVRKRLGTRRVGHAGALDPDASGVMLILVGKRYTRLTETLIQLDKSYRMSILIGAMTDTLDAEGKIEKQTDASQFSIENFKKVLNDFEGGYEQYVPVFSSVKVEGDKLRVLARKSESFEILSETDSKFVIFKNPDSNGKDKKLQLPSRHVELNNINLIELTSVNKKDININNAEDLQLNDYPVVKVELDCSKGTYVRQFAADVAEASGQAGMLIELVRTRIGQVSLDQTMSIDDVKLPN